MIGQRIGWQFVVSALRTQREWYPQCSSLTLVDKVQQLHAKSSTSLLFCFVKG
eukprot:m.16589 g.16589  ORF g.16589 m.16589 type:complete len:53 (-) comp11116_c0_seq2:170-328(-)